MNKLLILRCDTICVWNIAINHFRDRFPPYVLTVVSQFIVILTEKRCCLSFHG